MDYNTLLTYVRDIEDDQRDMEVRFGCDCGCGGDYYTEEEWDHMIYRSDLARDKLKEIGVTFNEDHS